MTLPSGASAEPAPARGYSSPLTGSVQLLDFPGQALLSFVLEDRLPPVFLPTFLHEATHFWCLASDLGAALALLQMRGHHLVPLSPADRDLALHDFGTVESAYALLSPLLEGMALFQEFDACPGESNVLSTPAFWAGTLFREPGDDPPVPFDPETHSRWLLERIESLLMQYRSDLTAMHRKTGVLMRSIGEDPHHYLDGYLSLKNVWLHAIGQTPAFLDRDLFLSFARDWIFEDWHLIGTMLDPDWTHDTAVYLFSERLQERLNALASDNLVEEVAIYDREIGAGTKEPRAMLRSLRQEEGIVRQTQQRLVAFRDDILRGLEGERSGWYLADYLTLEHRQRLLRLALDPVEIEVNRHGRAIVRKGPSIESAYMAGPAPADTEPGITPGWLAVYFIPEKRGLMILATRKDQPVLWLPSDAGDSWPTLRVAVTKVVETEAIRRDLTRLGRKSLGEEYPAFIKGVEEHTREVFARYAFSIVADQSRIPELRALLNRRGLYDLLGKDGGTLTALVLLSLLPYGLLIPEHNEALAAHLKHLGLDLESSLAVLQTVQEHSGFTLINVAEDRTILLV